MHSRSLDEEGQEPRWWRRIAPVRAAYRQGKQRFSAKRTIAMGLGRLERLWSDLQGL